MTNDPVMMDNRQQAYLDAMGVQVWASRLAIEPEPQTPALTATTHDHPPVGLKLGRGSGGIILICATDSDSASKLATDIGRSLGNNPVWAWPVEQADAPQLRQAVEDKLFTTVAIFGNPLAEQLLGQDIPTNLNSANVVVLPDMSELKNNPLARRQLWADLCRSGMVTIR